MLKIDEDNNIRLTRGNTLTLTVGMYKEVDPVPPSTEPTIEQYEPDPGDVITFAVSKGFKNETGYKRLITKEVPHDTMTFTCESSETLLDYDTFWYDVTITYESGEKDTFIEGTFKITGEA